MIPSTSMKLMGGFSSAYPGVPIVRRKIERNSIRATLFKIFSPLKI
jgi:hypothetical protein